MMKNPENWIKIENITLNEEEEFNNFEITYSKDKSIVDRDLEGLKEDLKSYIFNDQEIDKILGTIFNFKYIYLNIKSKELTTRG